MTTAEKQARALFVAAFRFECSFCDFILDPRPSWVAGACMPERVIVHVASRDSVTVSKIAIVDLVRRASDPSDPESALRAWCRANDAEDSTEYALSLYRAELARLEAM